jgi:hypothetical protein
MKNLFFFIFIPPPLLYIIFPVSMLLQGRQNRKKSMYLGPFENKILFQNKCLFLFCPYPFCSLPILLSGPIVKK